MKIDFWESESRILFLALAVLTVCTLSCFAYGIFTHSEAVFPALHLQEVITAEFPVRHFTAGLFDLKQMADNHIVYEYVYGGAPNYAPLSFYALLFSVSVGAVLLLSVAAAVSRLRFILSMGVFTVFLASLRLETLQIFGWTNKMPLIATAMAYLSLAFYLHVFRNFNLNKRVLAFGMLTAAVGCFIYFGAQTKAPLMFVAAHSAGAGMCVALLFIFIVAHEIPAFFIRLVSEVRERNLLHFLAIAAGYLSILLIAYLQETKYIRWGMWTPPVMLLIVVSALLGIGGYRQREPQHEAVFQFPVNMIFYVALLLISFGTLTFLFASSNDVGIDFFNDFGLYAHLGAGCIFLVYVIANFSPMLSQDMPVHKVLYKPTAMPYFTFRLASLIATYAFLVYHINWYQAPRCLLGSYYNAAGAAYYQQHDSRSSACFQRAVHYRSLNHQARYTMAYIAAEKLEPEKEKAEYEVAAKLNAAPYTFLNWSETYEREGNRDGAVAALREGLKKCPESGDLYNGLGLLFAKNKVFDSALFYFQKARLYADEGNANLLACHAQMRASFPADSLFGLTRSKSLGTQCNALALANFQELELTAAPPSFPDSALTAYQASWLGNYFVNALGNADTVLLNQTMKRAMKPCNESFYEYLLLAAAHAYYQQGGTRKAFSLVRQLAFRTSKAKYNKLLGLWSLEKQNPAAANVYFAKIKDASADFFQAIALTEADSLEKALAKWKELPPSKEVLQTISMLEHKGTSNDEEKFFYASCQIPLFDTLNFARTLQGITNPELKARAILRRTRRWLELEEVFFATRTFEKVRGLKVSKKLLDEITYQNLRLAAANKNWPALQVAIQNQKFDAWHSHDKIYYEALLEQQAENKECVKKFKQLLADDYLDEDYVTAAAAVLMKEKKERLAAFSQLSEALLQRPCSARLLKTYILAAADMGFQSEADESLAKLRTLLPPPQFNRFIETYPHLFSIQ